MNENEHYQYLNKIAHSKINQCSENNIHMHTATDFYNIALIELDN